MVRDFAEIRVTPCGASRRDGARMLPVAWDGAGEVRRWFSIYTI